MTMPAFSTSSAMSELWNRTADKLTKEELHWFSCSIGHAQTTAINASDAASQVACLVSSDTDSGALQHKESVANYLFHISEQFNLIHGLLDIGMSAKDRLVNPHLYRKDGAV